MKGKIKIILIAILIMAIVALCFGTIDYFRVKSFEKPIFCVGFNLADDGGSGKYLGLFYSFDIKGNFMPEDEIKGVTRYDYYIFGAKVTSGIRD